jgi:oxygen-dependent protoporphyrinogen oxidase
MRLVIIGGGISGLSLGYLLKASGGPSMDITVLESEEKPGGKIWTDRSGGFLCEWGVNGFLDNKPKTLELARELALEPLRSSDAARKRFVYIGGRLRQLPESPVAFLRSGLLSPLGKLRIFAEAVIPRGGKAEESLADFARRRLGREAFEKLIDPMASGIYAGDPEDLSLKSCFPRINELEENYGSLIRGMLKLKKRTGKATAGPGGTLTSFFDGMQSFTDALAAGWWPWRRPPAAMQCTSPTACEWRRMSRCSRSPPTRGRTSSGTWTGPFRRP